jgi:M6 family metalloprotease-like protein
MRKHGHGDPLWGSWERRAFAAAILIAGLCGPARAQSESPSPIEGTLTVRWFDSVGDASREGGQVLTVNGTDGRTWEVEATEEQLEAADGLLFLNGDRVRVDGRVRPERAAAIIADRIQDLDGRDQGSLQITGSQKYVWLLFRFADDSSTPEPKTWFETQALGPYPSLDNFWREVSFNNINLTGSYVVDWHNLPHNRSYYVYNKDPDDPGDEFDVLRLLADAIPLADPHVDFSQVVGLHFCFNGELDGNAWGGRDLIHSNEGDLVLGATYLPHGGWTWQSIVAHEGGHAFGLGHSGGQYGDEYDSKWDVMSNSCGTCTVNDPVYGPVGYDTNAYGKDFLGWIHPLHRFVLPATPSVAQVWLNDLAVVPPTGRYLIAEMMYETGSDTYLSLERRRFTGYDQNVVAESVVAHDVDPGRARPSMVIDGDANGDPNDAGAQWEPGEALSILTPFAWVIFVEQKDASGTQVTMSNAARSTVYANLAYSGSEDGSSTHPWNTFFEGSGSVYPNGNVYVAPGTYAETITLRKPATYQRWGSSGVVTIGQ